jgi:hypothetical protein
MLVLRVKAIDGAVVECSHRGRQLCILIFALRNGGTRSNFVPEMRLRFGVVTSSDEWQVS